MTWAILLLGMQGNGYSWTNPITPYIHLLIFHVHEILTRYRSMRMFTGQGKESCHKSFFYSNFNCILFTELITDI